MLNLFHKSFLSYPIKNHRDEWREEVCTYLKRKELRIDRGEILLASGQQSRKACKMDRFLQNVF